MSAVGKDLKLSRFKQRPPNARFAAAQHKLSFDELSLGTKTPFGQDPRS